jgi:hypothetical protein
MAAKKSTNTLPSEHDEQAGVCRWMDAKFPSVRYFAIPNGGHRAIKTAKMLKREGVKAGVPDMYIPAWRLWIEMKRVKGGRIEKDQADWHRHLESIGDTVIIGYGARDASEKILKFLDARSIRQ